MPWCEDCSRFYNPNTLRTDGTCPTCGRLVGEPGGVVTREGVPWHFKLLIGALSLYLGWRLLQGVGWVLHHL